MRPAITNRLLLIATYLLLSTIAVHAQTAGNKVDAKKHTPGYEKRKKIERERESEGKGEEGEHEEMAYEMKHKNSKWFKAMSKPNANYFTVKKAFDKYFGNHKWERSHCRETGEGWIKSKIFYLDKKGFVQDAPAFDFNAYKNTKASTPPGVTTRDVGTWHMVGPVNSNDGGFNKGGYVYMNRIDPTNPQKMFVSFLTGGLWMTSDGGASWTLTDVNMPDTRYNDLDVAISNPSIVYAISGTRVIKSADGGLTWATTTLTSSGYSGYGYDIAVSPTDPNVVIARWADKIYRTGDGGATWLTIVSGLSQEYKVDDCSVQSEVLDWSTTNNSVVYFVNTSNDNHVAVYRSADAGLTFSIMTTITLAPTANGQVVGWAKLLLPSNNTTAIYVAIGHGANTYGHHAVSLYELDNTSGAEILNRVNMVDGVTYELHHGDIAMDRENKSKIVYCGYGDYTHSYHYSTDNGVLFTHHPPGIHSDIRSIDMKNDRLMIGTDGDAVLSLDAGVTYSDITNSISNHELWGFGAAFKTSILAAGCNHGPAMVRDINGAIEWTRLSGADQGNTDVNPLDDRYIYSNGYDNYLYFRTGFGTFTTISNVLDAGGPAAYYNSFEFHPNLYYTIITHHAGQYPTGNPNLNTWKNSLIRSDDNGATVSIVHTFPDKVFREKICMTNPNVIYVIVGLSNNSVWKTTDGGATWANVTPSSAESSGQPNISDIAVGDVDPNQVWITYSGVQSVCKVLKSTNGGTSWTNLTQSVLTSNPNTKIIFQRGSNGGVYVGNNSGIYYRNNSMANWMMLGNGLPPMEIRYMFINYNIGKLRIGTSRGGWEHNLYETSPPKAQISASSNKVTCSLDTIHFKDYSTVRNASATWAWSFPGGTPSTSTLENPAVTYKNAPIGNYNVSLTVTDSSGNDTQTLTNFIQVLSNDCAIDTIPGKLLTLSNPGDYAQQSAPNNITTNTITLSCWIKPNGNQPDYTGLIFSGSGGKAGMNLGTGNRLGYHWQNDFWYWTGGPIIPIDTWSHVALVVTPDSAKVYLDGVPYTKTGTHPAINFNQAFQFGIANGDNSRNFKGSMDEVCIYNRALSTNEIRELMNLTRNNPNAGSLPGNDASLISYYQFNEGAGKPAYDKVGSKHATLSGGANKTATSTAPVGGGTFQRLNVSSGGLKDFATPGVELTFPASGTYPNGDIVVTRLNVPSDQLASPNMLPINPSAYYIIRNYGTNATFSALTDMTFKNVKGTTADLVSTPSSLKLFKRLSNADGATWGSSIDNADVVTNSSGTGTVAFNTGLTNTSFSQFSIGNTATCSMTVTAATPSACVPATNKYSLDVVVTYSTAPSGNITITTSNGTTKSVAQTSSPQTITLTGLTADGVQNINVTANFASNTACTNTLTAAYNAPVLCAAADCGCLSVDTIKRK